MKKLVTVITIALVISMAAFGGPSAAEEQIHEEHTFIPSENVFILLYHQMLPKGEYPTDRDLSYFTNQHKFESDINTMFELGYHNISLYDFYENNYENNKKYFIITFDDGYLSNYEFAYPILRKTNCTADIFLNTDIEAIGGRFSWEQAREMEESGYVTIHSHFPVHNDATTISLDDFESGLKDSYSALEANLGARKHLFFAYPHGGYNADTITVARDIGTVLQFIQWNNGDASDDTIYRTNISYNTDITELIKTAVHN